jgi:hypothetical protein
MAANDLTTVATAKDWLGITDSLSDTRLTRLVTAVSTAVQSAWLPRAQPAYTETRNGNGKTVLAFGNPRVSAVATLTIDGVAMPARSSVTGAGYTFDEDLLFLIGARFTRGVQNVGITYTAGFAPCRSISSRRSSRSSG